MQRTAIDIAKNRHEVLIQRPGRKRRRMAMTNDRDDHDRLVRQLRDLGGTVDNAFEATGDYHPTIAWRLIEPGFRVHLVSPVALARTREALHNSWDKNDPKDAQVMLSLGNVQRYYDPLDNGHSDWQELSKTHEAIKKIEDGGLASLEDPLSAAVLARDRPVSARLARRLIFPLSPRVSDVGRHHPTEQGGFQRGGLGLDRSKDQQKTGFIGYLRDGEYVIELARVDRLRGDRHVSPGRHADASASADSASGAIEAETLRRVGDVSDFHRLLQIPGIGPIGALTVLAEAGDLRRFGHHGQFLKFSGFNLATYQSGQLRGQTKLSKRGNARLSKAFWMAAQVVIRRRENNFRDKYRRYIRRDPDNRDLKRKALTAVASKVARVAYAMIKHETEYRPFHGIR